MGEISEVMFLKQLFDCTFCFTQGGIAVPCHSPTDIVQYVHAILNIRDFSTYLLPAKIELDWARTFSTDCW